MSMELSAPVPSSLYRVDSFTVPAEARPKFVERLKTIRDFLEDLPGCLYNRIIETEGADNSVRIMTIAEWEDEAALANARTMATTFYETEGFNPSAFMKSLNITPDFGLWRDITA